MVRVAAASRRVLVAVDHLELEEPAAERREQQGSGNAEGDETRARARSVVAAFVQVSHRPSPCRLLFRVRSAGEHARRVKQHAGERGVEHRCGRMRSIGTPSGEPSGHRRKTPRMTRSARMLPANAAEDRVAPDQSAEQPIAAGDHGADEEQDERYGAERLPGQQVRGQAAGERPCHARSEASERGDQHHRHQHEVRIARRDHDDGRHAGVDDPHHHRQEETDVADLVPRLPRAARLVLPRTGPARPEYSRAAGPADGPNGLFHVKLSPRRRGKASVSLR